MQLTMKLFRSKAWKVFITKTRQCLQPCTEVLEISAPKFNLVLMQTVTPIIAAQVEKKCIS